MVRALKNLFLLTLILGVAATGLVSGHLVTQSLMALQARADVRAAGEGQSTQVDRYRNIELFQKVLRFVETNYVDDVDNRKLIEGAIKGMMDQLDPHSNFLDSKIYREMKIDTSGKFGGLGLEIGMQDSVLTVVSPIEDTPAWEAGIKPGDRIIKINGHSTKGLTLTESVSLMRGKTGSKAVLTIFRKGLDTPRDITLERKEIKISSTRSEVLEGGYGYIRLKTFSESAASDVEKALAQFEKKGPLKGLVFDLRYTPGGLLDQAVEVASLFLDKGIVVSSIGRDKDQREVKHVRTGKARLGFPVAILVNSSTASAAEIVAGALQDHQRAVIMGQPTFGKGSIQSVIDLGDDVGLKLTIARYYTPSGRSIQEKGVQPDIPLQEYDHDLLEKAKINQREFREKDLEGHLAASPNATPVKGDYSMDELYAIEKGADSRLKDTPSKEAESFEPIVFDPKKDYQIGEALNYLRSYELFKKITTAGKTTTSDASIQ